MAKKNKSKLTFASRARKIQNSYKLRLGKDLDGTDALAKEALDREMNNLRKEQEVVKFKKQLDEQHNYNSIQANPGMSMQGVIPQQPQQPQEQPQEIIQGIPDSAGMGSFAYGGEFDTEELINTAPIEPTKNIINNTNPENSLMNVTGDEVAFDNNLNKQKVNPNYYNSKRYTYIAPEDIGVNADKSGIYRPDNSKLSDEQNLALKQSASDMYRIQDILKPIVEAKIANGEDGGLTDEMMLKYISQEDLDTFRDATNYTNNYRNIANLTYNKYRKNNPDSKYIHDNDNYFNQNVTANTSGVLEGNKFSNDQLIGQKYLNTIPLSGRVENNFVYGEDLPKLLKGGTVFNGEAGDSYEYKKDNDNYYARKIGGDSWNQASGASFNAIESLYDKKYGVDSLPESNEFLPNNGNELIEAQLKGYELNKTPVNERHILESSPNTIVEDDTTPNFKSNVSPLGALAMAGGAGLMALNKREDNTIPLSRITPEEINLERQRNSAQRTADISKAITDRISKQSGSKARLFQQNLAGRIAADRQYNNTVGQSYTSEETTNAQAKARAAIANSQIEQRQNALTSRQDAQEQNRRDMILQQLVGAGTGYAKDVNEAARYDNMVAMMGDNYQLTNAERTQKEMIFDRLFGRNYADKVYNKASGQDETE